MGRLRAGGWTAVCITLMLLAGCADSGPAGIATDTNVAAAGATTPVGELTGPYPVTRVVDGDTIHVGTPAGQLKVRLLGIDTPETVAPNRPVDCFGPQASAEAERLLTDAQVFLELDPSQGETDAFGRTLAYVWLDTRTMVNLALVRSGFATEYTYDDPYAYQEEFRTAQDQAREEGAGLWSPDTCAGDV